MTLFLTIAFRNMWRNQRRSLITIAAVALGLAALIFLRGFIHGVQTQIVHNLAQTLTGDIQIAPPTRNLLYSANLVIDQSAPLRHILEQDPHVHAYAERIYGSGVVASAARSIVTGIMGIAPVQEQRIASRRPIVQGRTLADGDDHGVMIGEPMRKILEVEIGDKIVVTAQDSKGELSGEAFRLVGTFATGSDMVDNTTVILLVPTAQRLLVLGDHISRIVVMLKSGVPVATAVAALAPQVAAATSQKLDVLSWEKIMPMFGQLLQFQNAMTMVVMVIVLLVVAAGTLNTLLMSILERTHELGIMLALGTTPRQVIGLITLESFWLTLLGTIVGVALGATATAVVGHVGINLSGFLATASNFMVGAHVFPRIDWAYVTLFVGVIIIVNSLAALYPAWKAGRLAPLEAMRHVG